MKTYDIAFTTRLADDEADLLSDEMMTYYQRVGVLLDELGISNTLSKCENDLRFDMTADAESHEEAQAICLGTFATACLFMGARMYRRKERPFDAYRQN